MSLYNTSHTRYKIFFAETTRLALKYNSQIRSGFASLIYMDEDEITRRLTKIDELVNQVIFAFMQTGMSYRQAEEEMFRRLKRQRFFKETEDQPR
jgi:hypothetical protein